MNRTLKLGLLYLLMIIPQHGNSPIPRMESWMEMDQGDGFVDRDLTSSLTGAENFGSAHKNYQKSLIRKKETKDEDDTLKDGTLGLYSEVVPNRLGRSPAPLYTLQKKYQNFGYSMYLGDRGQYMQPYSVPQNGLKDENYQMKFWNKNNLYPKARYQNQMYTNLVQNVQAAPVSQDKVAFDPGLYSISESRSYGPQAAEMNSITIHDGYNHMEGVEQGECTSGNEERLGCVKNELNEYDLKDMTQAEDQRVPQYDRDEYDPGLEESEYYNDNRGSALTKGDGIDIADVDYSQINPHGFLYKREGIKVNSVKEADKGKEISQDSINGNSKENSVKGTRSENVLRAVAPKEGHEISKTDTKSVLHNTEMDLKSDSNLRSKELNELMRASQKALEEAQLYQEKLAAKPQYSYSNVNRRNDHYLRGKKKYLEDKRNKREDEDEQKNMKTGTDEGGGEYEDEEGKGHNDEEEYYEEAELPGSKSRVHGNFESSLNQKLYKRETGKDDRPKTSKGEVSTEDYELTLENAPVENEYTWKKSSVFREATGKKGVTRKGVKIWDEWSKWSPCSVTCGVGRMTRWRHCIGGGCAQGEKEALIKKCTFPAC